MTTDSFTNTDGTNLSTHDANWTAFDVTLAAQGGGQITSNQAGMPTDYDIIGSYYAGSTNGKIEITKKPGTLTNNCFKVCVRVQSSTTYGYNVRFAGLSGDNFTSCSLYRDTTLLTTATSLSISRLSDIKVKLTATTNGANQDIECWINDTQLTWGAPSNALIHPDSTPITGGNPGFWITNSVTKAHSYFDDFSDLDGGSPITDGPALVSVRSNIRFN